MPSLSTALTSQPANWAENFANLRWRRDVATLLEVPEQYLIYYLYRIPPNRRYKAFEVRKKNGGARRISAPNTNLKVVQAKLAQILGSVYKPRPSAHGFIEKRSIVSNAKGHTGNRYVFNIDLLDFFPSINFGRVRGMFIAKPYNLPPRIATVLAQICTHDNHLPQGAPTSPIISNMICSSLDTQLKNLAWSHHCRYTRYADDITFSKSSDRFPTEIAGTSPTGNPTAGKALRRIIESNGFKINESKVRLQTRPSRQVVTGLVVNEKVNVSRRFIKNIRGAIHAYAKFGPEAAQKYFVEKYDKPQRRMTGKSPRLLDVIRGKVEFVGMVRGIGDSVYEGLQRQYKELDPNFRIKVEPKIFRSNSRAYTLIAKGGQGDNGQIFNVRDEAGAEWAIKLLNAEANSEKVTRFMNEQDYFLKNSHPNIVSVHDYGTHGPVGKEMPFYVMPYYQGTLRSLMNAGLAHDDIPALFESILDGMKEAHTKIKCHRDLKPENILYDPKTRRPLIADFGMAHFLEDYLLNPIKTKHNAKMGNFQYSAPEQRERGKDVDHRADIYALGVILNEMFTKRLALSPGYVTISSIAPNYGYLDRLVEDMLQYDPAKRPADVSAVSRLMRDLKSLSGK
jgi:RNA-directed DNA polymerase